MATTDKATSSLALPALQTYAVAVALAEAYLELVRNATTATAAARTETLTEGRPEMILAIAAVVLAGVVVVAVARRNSRDNVTW